MKLIFRYILISFDWEVAKTFKMIKSRNVQCPDFNLKTHVDEIPFALEIICDNKYEFNICFMKFGQMEKLNRHNKLVHDKVKAVSDTSKVKTNVEMFKEPKEKKIKIDSQTKNANHQKNDCNFCQRNFSRKYHLKRHMKQKHSHIESSSEVKLDEGFSKSSIKNSCFEKRKQICQENSKFNSKKKKKSFCYLCPTRFKRASSIQFHLEISIR